MRIGIVINTSWNIYNFRASLIKRLIAEGFQVIAIAPHDKYSEKLKEFGCSFRKVAMDNTGSNPLKDLRLFLDLRKIYQSEKLDLVLQFTIKPNIYGTFAAYSLGIKSINNVSGLGTVFINKGLTAIIAKMLYRKSFQMADLVFFQNKDDRDDFIDHIKIPGLTHDLVPGSGINLHHFQPIEHAKKAGFRFIMIARLIKDKGVIEYIEAAKMIKAEHPDVECLLLGQIDEDHKRGVKKAIIDQAVKSSSIAYLGTTDDVKNQIANSDCVVLPSYREGTPRTLLEAAAMAKPIITTDVPGCKEVVKNGLNGLLCKVKDATDLAQQMSKMVSMDEGSRNNLGNAGRRLVEEQFDEELVIDKYLKYIYQYSG